LLGSLGEQHVCGGGGGTGQLGPAFHSHKGDVRHPACVSRCAHGGELASFDGSIGPQQGGSGGGGATQLALAVQVQNDDDAQSLNAVRFAQGVFGSS
jgi:hypothetical protein